MMSRLKKSAIAAVSALALALPVATFATPAAAQGWYGGGWHGGGWHGGSWRGPGWGGGWRGAGWRGGGWGAPVAAGVLGLALGAVAASAAPWGGYGGCVLQNQPVYDSWGGFVGYSAVRVCY